MSTEHNELELEGDQRLTPFERLHLYLKDQESGSPRIQAIADNVELELIQIRINQTLSEGRRTLKGSSNLEPMIDDFLLEDLMQKAVIRETIRQRQFGVHAAEYNAASERASSLLRDYYNHGFNESGSKSKSKEEIKESAANSLLRDLWYINNKLSVAK